MLFLDVVRQSTCCSGYLFRWWDRVRVKMSECSFAWLLRHTYTNSSFARTWIVRSVDEFFSSLSGIQAPWFQTSKISPILIAFPIIYRCMRLVRRESHRIAPGEVSVRTGGVLPNPVPQSTDPIRKTPTAITIVTHGVISSKLNYDPDMFTTKCIAVQYNSPETKSHSFSPWYLLLLTRS